MTPRAKAQLALFVTGSVFAVAGAAVTRDDTWLIGEDQLMETLAATMFLGAGLIATWSLLAGPRAAPGSAWIVAPLGLLAALSEISFGARMFDIAMPPMEGGGELDGVHDIAMVLLRIAQAMAVEAPVRLALWVAGALAAGMATAWLMRGQLRRLAHLVVTDRAWMLLSVSIACLTAGVLLDLDLINFHRVNYVEEWVETAGAYWLLCAALAARGVALPTPGATASSYHGKFPTPG